MKLSIPEDDITLYETGFDETDFLNRKPFADKLSELIDKFETPFVVALDGPWGSGKSFFLKRWVGHHQVKAQDTVVVYLDAFALDYLDEPLVALVSEISARFEKQLPKSAKIWQSGKKIAAKLLPSVIRVAAAVATSGASELMARPFQVAVEKAAKEIDSAKLWEREHSRREAVTDFREFLESLTKGVDDLPVKKDDLPAKKIVVVIDELDRCRPDYALSMLEIIKHFFDVNNVHFILGVNLAELENMARARYGQGLDARNYIGKFVKINVQMPEVAPNEKKDLAWEHFFDKTAAEMGLNSSLLQEIKFQLKMLRSETITLRTIQRLLTSAAVVPKFMSLTPSGYYKFLFCSLFLFNFFRSKKTSSKHITFDDMQQVLNLKYKDGAKSSDDLHKNIIYIILAHILEAQEISKIPDADKSSIIRALNEINYDGKHSVPALVDDYILFATATVKS